MLASNRIECCPERFQMQAATHTVYEVTLALLPKQFIKIAFIIPQPLGFVILRLITINTFSWVQGGTGFPRVFLAFISRYTRFMLADV